MKKLGFALGICMILVVSGCAENDENNNTVQELNGTYLFGNIPDEVKAKLPMEAVKSIPDIGLYPSDIEIYGDYAYVVDSGNNAIHRIHLESLNVDKAYIDLGQNAGPFAVHVNDKAVYVSCQGSVSAVYRFDLNDNLSQTTVLEQTTLIAPTDIVTYGDDKFVVLDSEYDYANMTAAGSVYGLDNTGNVYSLKTVAQDPVFADILNINGQELVAWVTAGVVTWGTETIPPEKSCLEFFDPADSSHTLQSVCMKNLSLGRMAVTDTSVCVGNALLSQIHCIAKGSLKTASQFEETIAIHENDLGLTTPVSVGDNRLAVTDFNHDTISWIEEGNVLHLRLSPSEDAPKGPIDAVYDAERQQILVLHSTAGSVDVLRVK